MEPLDSFLLYKCGVEVSPRDRWGFTPASEAERSGHDKVSRLLELWSSGESQTLTSQSGQEALQAMSPQ